jgi:hypothetical protein
MCGLVCPSRTSEREGKGYCVKGGWREEEERVKERVRRSVNPIPNPDPNPKQARGARGTALALGCASPRAGAEECCCALDSTFAPIGVLHTRWAERHHFFAQSGVRAGRMGTRTRGKGGSSVQQKRPRTGSGTGVLCSPPIVCEVLKLHALKLRCMLPRSA